MDSARKSVFDSLDASGKLDPVRAQLRALLFQSLNGGGAAAAAAAAGSQSAAAAFPAESLLVHELIREYMQWAGMQHSLSVFTTEARMHQAAVPRRITASETGVPAAPADLPLLFAMLHECKNRDRLASP